MAYLNMDTQIRSVHLPSLKTLFSCPNTRKTTTKTDNCGMSIPYCTEIDNFSLYRAHFTHSQTYQGTFLSAYHR